VIDDDTVDRAVGDLVDDTVDLLSSLPAVDGPHEAVDIGRHV